MDPKSQRQYDKIFRSEGDALDKSIQSVSAPTNKMHYSLTNAVKKVIHLKLDDEEFDAPQIQADNIESYSTETLYSVLSKKFARMVLIVQDDETEIERLSEQNVHLKEKLAETIKQSEQLISTQREEVRALLEHNQKAHEENNLGQSDISKMQDLLQQREDEIRKLTLNQKRVVDEFVDLREKQHAMASRTDEIKEASIVMRQAVEEAEEKIIEYENVCFERQRELETLTKQRKVLETKLKQNSLKLNNMTTTMKKKAIQQDKSFDEYKRIMERNSLYIRKVADIEKEKEDVRQDVIQKTNELAHVRSLNEDYEQRIDELRGIEGSLRLEKDKHYKIMTEKELLKQQINELAPHSLIDISARGQATPGSKRSPDKTSQDRKQSPPKPTEDDRYAHMSPEEIQQEIEAYKAQSQQNLGKIERLEAENSQKIEKINQQRLAISQLHNGYTDKVQVLNLARTECDDVLGECNQLENEMELLIKKFGLLSELLNRNTPSEEQRGELSTEELEPSSYKMTFGQESRDDQSPKPDQLQVLPNRNDRSSVRTNGEGNEQNGARQVREEEEDDDSEGEPYLKRRPQPQKHMNSSSAKKKGAGSPKKRY